MATGERTGESWLSRREAPRPDVPPTDPAPAWELVEAGRYRPRRIRGSFPGRELG